MNKMKCTNIDYHPLKKFISWCRSKNNYAALTYSKEKWIYRQLEKYSSQIQKLINHFSMGKRHICVFSESNLFSSASVLAILASNKVYIPLNPRLNKKRIINMLDQTRPCLILVDKFSSDKLISILNEFNVGTCVLSEGKKLKFTNTKHHSISVVFREEVNESLDIFPSDCVADAYIFFTSGSTGTPSGVVVKQGSLSSYIDYFTNMFDISSSDVCTQNFSSSFDVSLHDLLITWSVGASLCIPSRLDRLDYERFIQDNRITIWLSTPSLAHLMFKIKKPKAYKLSSLRKSFFIGEIFTYKMAYFWSLAAPQSEIINLYGPTEATITFLSYSYTKADRNILSEESLPISTDFTSQPYLIVDKNEKPVTDDMITGQLWLGGPQIASRYLNNDTLTKEKFHEDKKFSMRWFKTGDFVTRDQGCLFFNGRQDSQYKILGHRIEFTEINNILSEITGASRVYSIPWPVVNGVAEGIVSYIQTDIANFDEKAVLKNCRESLPEYFVPKKIIPIQDLPLSVNGKVDIVKLKKILTN